MSYADDTCDVCGKLGATVTIYWSDGYMLHAHAECRPEKERSACTERHQGTSNNGCSANSENSTTSRQS